jgi:gamma-glutamyltranspeptidase/glutathione hydrolase
MTEFNPIEMDFNSRRSPVLSRKGMVAASQPLAVAAGLTVLRAGGNAADAAVATAAALNVTEPTSTGIGGDAFCLYYDAATKQVSALNGSGRSPAALTLEKALADGYDGAQFFHPHTITVPGAAAAWVDVVETLGRLSLAEVLAPAIELAEGGFPVAPITAYFWARGAARQLAEAPNGHELTLDGRAPHAGETFRNPGLARTFKALAEGGKDAYYRGEIAESIVKMITEQGGVMTLDDLAGHTSLWAEPIHSDFQGYRVWECPPNGQGLAALLALNILEAVGIDGLAPLSIERLHLEIEALRLAFADTRWYAADPEANPAPLDELLSKSYAAERAKWVRRDRATLDQTKGTPTGGSDTVYLTAVDGEGNACSFINSNYMGFGTGFVPKGWGFTLQNRGHGFSLELGHPNVLAPGKRPYHTIIPALITHAETGELFASYGVMGGFMQPQGHMQVALGLIADRLDPQSALDRPRFCIADGSAGGRVALEEGIPVATMAGLAALGHPVYPVSGHARAVFGRGQVIVRDGENGALWGGSDPRADGLAMGV